MKMQLKVIGMHCKSCELLIMNSLEELGVKSKADYKKGIIDVEFDESKLSKERIIEAIEKEGYKVK